MANGHASNPPNQALQQTGHANSGLARHDVLSRVSRLLSLVVRRAEAGPMAIYGFGAMFGGDTDVSGEFLRQGMACVGWSEQDAPPLFDILRNISNGDLVFIKSFNPQVGLTIKAVGVVTDRTIRQYPVQGQPRQGVSVCWVWQGSDPVGKIDDKYPVRSLTLFEEHTPSVQSRVIRHLLGAVATRQAQHGSGEA
jgi:hypothetical protein